MVRGGRAGHLVLLIAVTLIFGVAVAAFFAGSFPAGGPCLLITGADCG